MTSPVLATYLELSSNAFENGNEQLAAKMLKAAIEQAADEKKLDCQFAYACERIADAAAQKKSYKRAEEFYKRAVTIYSQHLGPHHTHVAHLWDRLGDLAREQHRFSLACRYWKRAVRAELRCRSAKMSRVADFYRKMALAYVQSGDEQMGNLYFGYYLRAKP